MIRRRENLIGRAALHYPAEVHHDDTVREVAHDRKIMADEQQRRAVVPLDVHQQAGDGGLNGDVERRNRLVGDDHFRIAGERPRDADALLLAARQLARTALGEIARQLDDIEQLADPCLDFVRIALHAKFADDPANLSADRVAGVQSVKRVLEDHLQTGNRALVASLNGQVGQLRSRQAAPSHLTPAPAPSAPWRKSTCRNRIADNRHGFRLVRAKRDLLVGLDDLFRADQRHAARLDHVVFRQILDAQNDFAALNRGAPVGLGLARVQSISSKRTQRTLWAAPSLTSSIGSGGWSQRPSTK